jgi:predicted MPP superfamily phosphohydrolase
MRNALTFSFVLLCICVILALAHWLIYATTVRVWGLQGSRYLPMVKLSTVILCFSFVGLSVLNMRIYTLVGSWLYTASAVWLGTVLWLTIASILALAVFSFSPTTSKALIILALLVSTYGVIHGSTITTKTYSVAIPNLPEAWVNKKVALIADTHLGSVRGHRFTKKVVEKINAENPDAVFIAGDFYDGPPAPYKKLAEPLSKLTASKGIFFANGNHEEFQFSTKVYEDAISQANVTVLSDAMTVVDGLQIIGVNYRTTNDVEQATKTLASIGINPSIPSILIKHSPVAVEAVRDAGISLQVSGHTHRGQVWPMSLLVNRIYKQFAYGQHVTGGTTVITTSGAGTWGPPQRIGTNNEIVIITLTQ